MTFVNSYKLDQQEFCSMIFSKSFGYAIRCILFLAMQDDVKRRIQLDEIAETLQIPRFFLGKVMKKLAKEGIVDSVKGHKGGFSINENTLDTKLSTIAELTGDGFHARQCALHPGACDSHHPCAIHWQIEPLKLHWNSILMKLTVLDLLSRNASAHR